MCAQTYVGKMKCGQADYLDFTVELFFVVRRSFAQTMVSCGLGLHGGCLVLFLGAGGACTAGPLIGTV